MASFEFRAGNFSLSFGSKTKSAPYTALPVNYLKDLQLYTEITERFFGTSTDNEIIEAIKECPPLGTILFNKSEAHTNGIIKVLQKDEEKDILATGKQATQITKLLLRPNPLQTGQQFFANVKFNIGAFGSCLVLKVNPVGFTGIPSALWVLPKRYSTVTLKKNINPYYITTEMDLVEKIEVKLSNTTTITIPVEDVFLYRDKTPISDDGFFPQARPEHLKYHINNLTKGLKTEGRIISKPLGAFTRKDSSLNSPKIKEEDKRAAERMFGEKYGTGDGQSDIVFLETALDFQQLMYPIRDLQIFEGRNAHIDAICTGMGYPSHKFGNDKNATYNNLQQADTSLYQDYIVPEAKSMDEQTAAMLGADLFGIRIKTDFSHVTAMQQNEKDKSDVYYRNSISSINAFKANTITYGEMCLRNGNKEPFAAWRDRYWKDFNDQERTLFDFSQNNQPAPNGTQN